MGYTAEQAQVRARRRAPRPRTGKLRAGRAGSVHAERRALVVAKLADRWSPQQIAGWLRTEYPDQPELWVPHETIYQALYVQSRGSLRAGLTRQVALGAPVRSPLRSGRPARIPRGAPAGACRSPGQNRMATRATCGSPTTAGCPS